MIILFLPPIGIKVGQNSYENLPNGVIRVLNNMRRCAQQDRERPIPIINGKILYQEPKKEDT